MNVSLYQAASAMSANARWQDVVSQNLASASVPGFKKQDLSFSSVQAGLLKSANGSTPVTLPRVQSATNFQQGESRYTGVNTDVAIDGDGFFEIQLANGSTAYTRDGEFQVNAQGQLVTKQGCLVLGDRGPIQLDRNNPNALTISATGEVAQGKEPATQNTRPAFPAPGLCRILQHLVGHGNGQLDPCHARLRGQPARRPNAR